AEEVFLLNEAKTPPFELDAGKPPSEDLRLKFRYIDLRRQKMQENLRLRHRLTMVARNYLDREGFFDIETPILTKSTPEGARDYQVARCFRDEDLRADRQPEFTQIDIEMSFVQPEDIFNLIEPMIVEMFAMRGVEVKRPFPRLSYAEVMERFGSDKPDTRFG